MLNIHTDLLEIQKEIGCEAFCVLLHIAKRIGREMSSFPSLATLQRDTGLSDIKVSRATKILVERGLLKKEGQMRKRLADGRFGWSSMKYTITTEFLSVFINLKNKSTTETRDFQTTQNEASEIEGTQIESPQKEGTKYCSVQSIVHDLSIEHDLNLTDKNFEKTLNEKVEDPKISYVEFAKEFPQEKTWESPNIKNSTFKQKEKVEIISKELKEFIDYWNQSFGTRFKYSPAIQKNLTFWLKHHSMEDIFEAISMLKYDTFWRTKLDPTSFLRQKNPSGENVDRIDQFKNLIIDEKEITKNMTGMQKVEYYRRKEARQKQELQNLI